MSIEENLAKVMEEIKHVAEAARRDPRDIALVVVSKGRDVTEIEEAYAAGCRDFGETRVQEVLEKIGSKTPSDIRWHLIGNLQKNKVNKVVGRFLLIHSVDSFELAEALSKASLRQGVVTAILLQANTSQEESKSGLSSQEWESCFLDLLELKGIEMHGLMTMAPLTEDESRIRHCFSELRSLRDRLQEMAREKISLSTLSMGMSSDFAIAIQEGATLLRIGTKIFVPR